MEFKFKSVTRIDQNLTKLPSATDKMAREKEEEREQARDRMLREEMAKRKRRLES